MIFFAEGPLGWCVRLGHNNGEGTLIMKRTTGFKRQLLLTASMILLASMAARADDNTVRFDVPAQSLDASLRAFGVATDRQVVFTGTLVAGRRANAVRGEYKPEEALTQILDGSGLTYETSSSGVLMIKPVGTGRLRSGTTPTETTLRPGDTASARQTAQVQSTPDGNMAARSIEEVIVTAQKRSESILSVPMSISAVSAQAIEKRGLVSFDDFLRSIPGVNFNSQSPGQSSIFIRGVSADFFSTGPTVGIYFGDVPLTGLSLGASADVKLVDMTRVEVLRGPQGTLYGSNSLSGTIRHIPTAPALDAQEGRLTVGFSTTANYGGANGEVTGVVNVPIVADKLALRVVGYHFDNSGFIKNVAGDDPAMQVAAAYFGATGQAGNQDHIGGSTITGGRAALLWQPSDVLSVGLTYVHQTDGVDDRPFAQLGRARYERSTYRFGPIVGDGDAMKIKLDIANATIDYETSWGSFLSSTAFIKQDYRRLQEIGIFYRAPNGLAGPIPQDSVTNAENFSEELRFTSTFDGPVQLIAGVFYENSDQPTEQYHYYTGDAARNPFSTTPLTGLLYAAHLDRQVEQKALFGEISYDLTQSLKLTAGARAFKYDTRFISNFYFTTNPARIALANFNQKSAESGETFKFAAEYKPNDDALLYAKFAQGFRLGRPKNIVQIQNNCDVNRDGLIDGTQLSATDPLIKSDSLDSYEAGAKSALFGGRASLSASGYHNRWQNMPVTVPACGPFQSVFNVGKARATGFEVEGNINLVRDLPIDFGVGYVDSQLSTTTSLGPKGAMLNFLPKWNGHVGAEYRFGLVGNDSYVRGDFSFYGPYWSGVGRTGQRFAGYGVLDLTAGITLDRVQLVAFVNNVTDTYAVTTSSSFPPNGIYPLRPRTLGVKATTSF